MSHSYNEQLLLIAVFTATLFQEYEAQMSVLKKDDSFAKRPCDATFCNVHWTPIPNLKAALNGYDAALGDPLSPQGDPGWKQQIFEGMKPLSNISNKMILDDNIAAHNFLHCSGKTETRSHSSFNDFSESIIKSYAYNFDFEHANPIKEVKTGIDIDVPIGKVVNLHYHNIVTRRPPKILLSYGDSNNEMTKDLKRFYTSDNGMIVSVQATCITHKVMILRYVEPKFRTGFQSSLYAMLSVGKRLAQKKDIEEIELVKKELVRSFLSDYGTHFSRLTLMGSKIMYLRFIKESEKRNFTERDVKSCAETKGLIVMGLRMSADEKSCKRSNSPNRTGEILSDDNYRVMTWGTRPSDDVNKWAELTVIPVPVTIALVPVLELITFENIQRICTDKDIAVDDVFCTEAEFGEFLTFFSKYYQEYCSLANLQDCMSERSRNLLMESAEKIECGIDVHCKFNENCISKYNDFYCVTRLKEIKHRLKREDLDTMSHKSHDMHECMPAVKYANSIHFRHKNQNRNSTDEVYEDCDFESVNGSWILLQRQVLSSFTFAFIVLFNA